MSKLQKKDSLICLFLLISLSFIFVRSVYADEAGCSTVSGGVTASGDLCLENPPAGEDIDSLPIISDQSPGDSSQQGIPPAPEATETSASGEDTMLPDNIPADEPPADPEPTVEETPVPNPTETADEPAADAEPTVEATPTPDPTGTVDEPPADLEPIVEETPVPNPTEVADESPANPEPPVEETPVPDSTEVADEPAADAEPTAEETPEPDSTETALPLEETPLPDATATPDPTETQIATDPILPETVESSESKTTAGNDPWFYLNMNLYQFPTFQEVIKYLKDNAASGMFSGQILDVMVEAGEFTDDLTFEGFSEDNFQRINFTGGCSLVDLTCSSPTSSTLNGTLSFINSNASITFKNFIYANQILLNNATNITLEGSAGTDKTIDIVDQGGANSITFEDSTGNAVDAISVTTTQTGGYDNADITVDGLLAEDIEANFSQSSTNPNPGRSLTVKAENIAKFDLSLIPVNELTYYFDRLQKEYRLAQASDDGGSTRIAGKMDVKSEFVTVRFSDPKNSLTIKTTAPDSDLFVDSFNNDSFSGSLAVLGDAERDNVTINTDLLLKGQSLKIKGNDVRIAKDKVISTRKVNTTGSPDYETAASTGNSGNILIEAVSLVLEKVKILAHATDPFTGGDVSILAEDTNGWNVAILDWLRENLGILIGSGQGIYVNAAEVSLKDVVIKGNQVDITARSGYSVSEKLADEIEQVLNASGVGELLSAFISSFSAADIAAKISDLGILNNGLLPIPVGVNVRVASSKINLSGTTSIRAKNDINILSSATGNADLTIKSVYFSLAVGVSVARSLIDLTDSAYIHSEAGNILLQSDANGNASVTTATSGKAESNKFPFSVAVGVSVIDSRTTTGKDTKLNAHDSVNVIANGANIGGADASVVLYDGGNNAVTLAVYTGVSNVLAKVDGKVTANTVSDARSYTPIDLAKINQGYSNSLNIPNHGLRTGQKVVYHAAAFRVPIPGLTDGEQYTVLVIDADNIRLIATEPIHLSTSGVEPGLEHSFTPYVPLVFQPGADVIDVNTSTFKITGHGFANGQKIRYSSMQENLIGGLLDGVEYTVQYIDANQFQLLLDGKLVSGLSLPESGSGEQSFWFFDANKKKSFIPVPGTAGSSPNVDSAANQIYLPDHGFETGDMVYYWLPDGTITRDLAINYGFEANANGVLSGSKLKLTYADGLAAGDSVIYRAGDHTGIGGLIDGGEYKIASITLCDPDDPDDTCRLVTLMDALGIPVTFGAITADPANVNSYTPVHSLVKTIQYERGNIQIGGLNEWVAYYVVKTDDDHFMLAKSLEEAEEISGGIALSVPSDTSVTGHTLDLGLTNGIGVRALLTTTDTVAGGSYFNQDRTATTLITTSIKEKVMNATKNGFTKAFDWIKKKLDLGGSKNPESKEDTTEKAKSAISVAGGVGIITSINAVKAEVGSNAILSSSRDIEVFSALRHEYGITIESETSPEDDAGSKGALGAAISVVVLVDSNKALISDGAVLDADRDILIDAKTSYPSRIRATLLAIQQAGVGDIVGVITDSMDSTSFVFYSSLFNGLVRSVAAGSGSGDDATKIGVAGSMGFVVLDSGTEARIGDRVRINQTKQNNTQNVKVSSAVDASFVNVAGNFSFNVQPGLARDKKIESVKKFFKDAPGSIFSLYGTSGTKSGVGGSVYVPVLIFRSLAEIGNNTLIHVGDQGSLTVSADTAVDNFTFVQAGSQAADGFAVAGAISYTGIFNTTTARIAPLARIQGGSVVVAANDNTHNYALLGSLAKGTSAGVGVSIGVNTVLREVNAIIGDAEDGKGGPWRVVFNDSNSEPITVEAVSYFNGNGTVTTVENGAADTHETQLLDADIKPGTTLTYGSDTTGAIDTNADAQKIADALNALASIQAAGGVTVTEAEEGGWLVTFNTTGAKALIISNNAVIEVLEKGALDQPEQQKLNLGGATQGGFRLIFQDQATDVLPWDASEAQITAALNALSTIKNLKADGSGTVTVARDTVSGDFIITFNVAEDLDEIMFEALGALDGSFYINQTGGNQIQTIFSSSHDGAFYLTYKGAKSKLLPHDATYAQILDALQELSTISAAGGVTVQAADFGDGAGTINISGPLEVQAKASGDNWVFALAAAATTEKKPGSGGGSQSGGSGMPRKHWQKTILVDLKLAGQNFGSTGSNSMSSGSGSNGNQKVKNAFSFAGDFAVNVLIDKVTAAIRNAGRLTAKNVTVNAVNDTTLRAATGAAALTTNGEGTSFGIAGSVSFNWMDGFTRAAIENVKFGPSAENNIKAEFITVSASRTGDIFALAAGAAGAPKEKGIAITGSVAISVLKNRTEAILSNLKAGSEIAGPVTVEAKDTSQIIGSAGALSYGGKGGFGAAFTLNLIKSATSAIFRDSDLKFHGNLNLTGEAKNTIISAAGAVGASKDKGGVGITLAINLLLNSVNTVMERVSALSAAGNTTGLISAENSSTVINAAGALGAAKTAGVGVVIAFNLIQPQIKAAIMDSRLEMGNGAVTGDSSSLTVSAKDGSTIYSVSAGGAGAEKVAVAGAISANIILTDVEASIKGAGTVVKATGDISIRSTAENNIYAYAGNAAGAGKVAVGAAFSFNMSNIQLAAFIDGAKVESTNGNIFVQSSASGEMIGLAAGAQGAGKVAVGGSVVIGLLNNNISAYVNNGAELTAEGSVSISADDQSSAVLVAGVVGGAGTAAVGVSNSTFISKNSVLAYTGANVKIKGKGKKAVVKTLAADVLTPGAWQHVYQRGVFINAISDHAVRIFAAVGAGAGTAAVSGSGTLSILNDTVKAYVDKDSTIDATNTDSEDDLSSDPEDAKNSNPITVRVLAAGKTTMWGVAGALAGAGTVGVGVGLDVGVLTKNVEAYIDGTVTSEGDIIVQALSTEEIISVSASLGAGGTVGVSGSIGVFSLNLTTTAYAGSNAILSAKGSVLVSAYDATFAVLTVGSLSGGGTAGVGTSLDVVVSLKDVSAYIDQNAKVDAVGNGKGLVAFSGSYTETYQKVSSGSDDETVNVERPTFDPGTVSGDTITFTTDPKFKTGDTVVYSSGKDADGKVNKEIGGLADGMTYYVIVDPTNPKRIRLALDYLDAKNGIWTPLDPSVAAGSAHTLWNGKIEPSGYGYKLPGVQYSDDLNGDGETDNDPNEKILTEERVAVPETIKFNGIAVSAVNEDTLLTIVISAGGAGTAAVNVSGLTNVVQINVDAHIGENALINQTPSLTLNGKASVYVLAGNDFFHIGVVPAAGFSGTASVAPGIDVTVYGADVKAVIADGARVKAEQDVIVNANAQEQFVSVVAGVAGSGTVAVGGSVGVVVISNTTLASIGDDDGDLFGATVSVGGNVLVNAYDKTHIVLVSGSLGIGLGAVGVGGSIGVLVEKKNTTAMIAPYSAVTALGGGTALMNKAFEKSMAADGSFTLYSETRGIVVQAYSKDQIVTVVGAGAGGFYAGVAGAVLVNVFLSDTFAIVGAETDIISRGDVLVTALNHSKIFNFAGSIGGGIAGVGGSVAVDVVRNNAKAIIGRNATVSARKHVQVAALSNKDTTTISASLGGGVVGVGLSLLIDIIGDEFTASFETSYSETERDQNGDPKTDSYDDTIIEDPLGDDQKNGKQKITGTFDQIQTAKGGFSSDLNGLHQGGTEGKDETNSSDYNTLLAAKLKGISERINQKDVKADGLLALSATGAASKSGTIAVIEQGAIITLSDSDSVLDVIAQERIKYLGIGGSVTGGAGAVSGVVSISVIGSNVNAIIESGTELTATTINVEAALTTDIDTIAVAGSLGGAGFAGQVTVLYDHANQVAGIGKKDADPVKIKATNINVKAGANRNANADAAGLSLSGGMAIGISVAVSVVDGQTLAYLEKIENMGSQAFGDVMVSAVSEIETLTLTINLAGSSVAGSAGVAVNTVKPQVETYINGSTIDSDKIAVIAGLRAKVKVDAASVALGAVGGGLNVAVAVHAPSLKAYINNSSLYNQSDILIKTFYNYADDDTKLDGYGPRVTSAGIAGGGTVAIAGNISVVNSSINASTKMNSVFVKDPKGLVRLISLIHNEFESKAVGATVGGIASAIVNMAVAENSGGSYVASISNSEFPNGFGILINNHVSERAYAETKAASAALFGAGFLNISVAVLEPEVQSSIVNMKDSSFSNKGATEQKIEVIAQYDGDASANAFGINVSGGLSLGVSVAVSHSSPVIEAYLESDADHSTSRIYSEIPVLIEARQNINADGTFVETGAQAYANASGGGYIAGNGSIAIAKNHAAVKAWAGHRGKMQIENLTINALSYNKSDAQTFGVVAGLAGLGASVSSATSDGDVEAWLDTGSALKTISILSITAATNDDAYAYSLSGVGGIVGVGASVANAWANTNSKTEIRSGGKLDANSVTLLSSATPKAYAFADGVTAGGLAVGASEASANAAPSVNAAIKANISALILDVQALKNYPGPAGSTDTYNSDAYARSSTGALIGVNATVARANDHSSVIASVADNVTLEVIQFTLSALNFARLRAVTTNVNGAIIAAGGSDAKSSSDVTTKAMIQNGVKLYPGTLGTVTILAYTEVDHTAQSSSGSGGVIAGTSTHSTTESKGDTRALIGTGSEIKNGSSVQLTAVHTTKTRTSLESVTGGVIAGAGVYGTNTVDSTVVVGIGQNSKVIAGTITLAATNKTDVSDAQSGTTGGVVSGAGAYSSTTIKLTTRVDIGPSATLQSNGVDKSLHQILIAAENIVNANSMLTFTTGGVVTGAGGYNTISAKEILAEVVIGAGSQLISNGAMAISTRGSGTLEGTTDIETFGAGTVMTGKTLVEIYPKNQIIVHNGAKLEAQNDLTLAAGRSTINTVLSAPDTYKVHARWDGFAGSAFPIDDVDAFAFAVQTNLIRIAAGGIVRSGNQLSLYAENNDSIDLLAKAKVVSWVSQAADGISKLFSNNSTELFTGQSLAESHATVEMNGTAETGFNRDQRITFENLVIIVNDTSDATKNIYSVETPVNIGNIEYTLGIYTANSPLVEALHHAQQMLADFGATNSTLWTFYTNEIARIQAQLATYYPGQDASGTTVSTTSEVITITIPQIIAAAGRIDIRTGILQGTGTFIAPGNSKVEIINNTQAFLNILGILIPDDNGGVYLNTVRLGTDNSVISESNEREVELLNRFNQPDVDPQAVAGVATFVLPQPPAGSNVPSVLIENRLNIADYTPNVQGGPGVIIDDAKRRNFEENLRWPDITLLSSLNNGTGIINPNGSVDIITVVTGKSTVKILNTVRSIQQNIISGGDVYVEGLTSYSVGGETSDFLNNSSGYYTYRICGTLPNLYICPVWVTVGSGLGDISQEYYNNYVNGTSNSTLFGDRISIQAEYINLNGIIQSGREVYKLTITNTAWIEATALMITKQGRIFLPITSRNNPGFSVYYNTLSKQFETDPIKSSGGYVELFGKVLSTGQGQIKVLSGYPTVTIINNTDINVLIGGIDLSLAGAGTLIIHDYAGGTPSLDPSKIDAKVEDKTYTSIFTHSAGQIEVETSGSATTSKTTTVTGATINYAPDKSWYYGWTTVQTTTQTRYAYVKRGNWLDFVPDVFQVDDDEWGSWQASQAQYGGNGPYYFKDDNPNRPDLVNSSKSITNYDSGTLLVWSNTYWTWYGTKVYEATYKQVTGTLHTYTHEINAHQPIKISFVGAVNGDISIQSNGAGSVILQGALANPTGDVTIESKNGGIFSTDDSGSVSAIGVTLKAYGGIGMASQPVVVQLVDKPRAFLYTYSTTHSIYLKNLSGDLKIDVVSAGDGNVSIESAGSLIAAENKAGQVSGQSITLKSGGGIGVSKDAPLRINSNQRIRFSGWYGRVNITALDNIYLEETTGDLYLEKMTTNGDVWLKVPNGSLIDANTLQTRDERTYDDLLNSVYKRLQLLNETGAQAKIDNLYQSVIVMKTQEYRTYWQYRNLQADPTSFDDAFVVELTAAESVFYTDFYKQQGIEQGLSGAELDAFVADALQTLENSRTEQYRTFHASYGKYGDAFDTHFNYTLSDAEKTEIRGTVKVWTEAELLQLISANLLKPVSSTMTDIEDPNIVARNVTLEVSGTIGIFNKTPVIIPVNPDGTLGTLTDDQKVALAAAERSDVLFIGPNYSGDIFFFGNALWASAGINWETLGFAEGMQLQIQNAMMRSLFGDGLKTLKITAINGSVMTIDAQITLVNAVYTDLFGVIEDVQAYTGKITSLHIYSRDDVNIDATGVINTRAGDNIYLGGGTEMQGDLNLGVIESINGGEIRIKSHRNINNMAETPQNMANVITTGDVVLEGGSGSVGDANRPIYTLIGGAGTLTARAFRDVITTQCQLVNGACVPNSTYPYLTAGNAPDLRISSIYAQTGDIVIRADGLILDGEHHDFSKVLGRHVTLIAGDAIGAGDDPLEVHTAFSADQPQNGWLMAVALNTINIADSEGDMGVKNVLSYRGDVMLAAQGSILDAGDLKDPYTPDSGDETDSVGGRWPKANVIGNNITLKALAGGIGAAGNELDIDTRYASGNGVLTVESGNLLNTYLIETIGDLWLNRVKTGKDVITFITVPAGSILNGAAAGLSNIISGKTKLFASNNIGAKDNKLSSEVGALEGTATNGGVWIDNKGALTLGQVTDSPTGVHSNGDIEIMAGSPIVVAADQISDSGSIIIWAKDNDDVIGPDGNPLPDNLTVKAGVTIHTRAANALILLAAGDDLIIEAGATLISAGDIILRADSNTIDANGDLDPALDAQNTEHDAGIGALVELRGTYTTGTGNWVYVQTYGDNDVIHLYSSFNGKITTGAGNDQIRFHGGAVLTGDGTVDGGSGSDTLDHSDFGFSIDVILRGIGTTDGFRGNVNSVSGGFDNINWLIGSPFKTDNLTGLDQDALWHILAGYHAIYTVGANALEITGIEILNGGNATDVFRIADGAANQNVLHGGNGDNWLDYSLFTTPVSVDLTYTTATGLIPGNFTGIDNVIGGRADDNLIGNARNNRLFGGPGNDIIYGLDGDDLLNGGAGFDRLYGGKGNDTFTFAGNEEFDDLIEGDTGLNTLHFLGSNTGISIVLVGLGQETGFRGVASGQTGSFTNIGNLIGSGFDDSLYGLDVWSTWEFGKGFNRYIALGRDFGFSGVENVIGGTQVDIFLFTDGGYFNCTIDGGPDRDNRLDFSQYTTPVYVDLSTNTYSAINGTVINVLWIIGGQSDDILIGNDLPNVIDGGPGDDVIYGLGGDDIIYSGDGNNILYGGDGDDYFFAGVKFNIIYGGDGYDTADIARPGRYWIPLFDVEVIITHEPGADGPIREARFLVINVVSSQEADVSNDYYDGFIVRLPSLDQVLVLRDTAQRVMLSLAEESGGSLPRNLAAFKGMVVQLLRNDIRIKYSPNWFMISFALPAGADASQYAILFWDEDALAWVEIPAGYVMDPENGGVGRLQAWVGRTGKYILALKGL